MLKLTETYKDRTIYINLSHIIVFQEKARLSGEVIGTEIVTLKETYVVKEKPEEIEDMLLMANITLRI